MLQRSRILLYALKYSYFLINNYTDVIICNHFVKIVTVSVKLLHSYNTDNELKFLQIAEKEFENKLLLKLNT